MDKNKVIEKIKKCLALSKSANEHEAAQALKQAQALMNKYQINEDVVALSEISEVGVICTQSSSLPRWQVTLVQTCSAAFGVGSLLGVGLAKDLDVKRVVKFYGLGAKPALAAYAYEVLLRKVKKEREQYIKHELKRVSSPRQKTARADAFCEGWVWSVSKAVQVFAVGDEEADLIKKYEERKRDLKAVTPRLPGKGALQADAWAGAQIGKDVQLHHAMNSEKFKQIGE